MLFTEGRFLILFAAAFCLYWSLGSNEARKRWLLLCSFVFYGAWDWRFLGLMLVSIVMDWGVGLGLSAGGAWERRRRALLIASVVGNLSILGFFKYYGFFVDSAVDLLNWLGFQAHPRTLEIVLPVGISFYTFQSMSYTIDVYRRQLAAERELSDFALFVAFFPQLVAGPIVRAVDFLPQLRTARAWGDVRVRACLGLFLVGFVKKACIADNIAAGIDAVYARPLAWTADSHWASLALYSIQVYCDFSGYSDMAIATAGLLGYRLALNFDFPMLACDITDWWRRWHISLSTWFRDYLYLPLGGNRLGKVRTYVNLWTVFFLCGLWHGAQWKYVIWGLMAGAYLMAHRFWRHTALGRAESGWLRNLSGWALTTFGVMMWWPIFRGVGYDNSRAQIEVLFGLREGGERRLGAGWIGLILLCLAVHMLTRGRIVQPWLERLPGWAFAVGFGACAALAAAFTASGYQPFVYFQF
jgi:D-alanyl-lipoteichoic acid acyltransferase DltB (MBOAT superfamily)